MTTFVEITLACPSCRTVFGSRKITSCGNRGQDTDFRPHYWGMDPLPYFVHACPACEFCGPLDDFQDETWELPTPRECQEAEAVPNDLPGSRKCELAAERYRRAMPPDHCLVADLYLRGSWCARLEEHHGREAALQRQAILNFEEALEDGDLAPDRRAIITYLTAELYRRVGRFDFARALFAECLKDESAFAELDWLPGLVQRQTSLACQGIAANTSFGD